VGGALAAAGMPVVGWNSLQYYWRPRSPEAAAADLARIVRHYFAQWHEQRVVLIGYSFGADVLPFLVNRLPADLRSKVALVTLLGPSREATFEFHVAEWLGSGGADGRPTLPEVSRIHDLPLLGVYGEQESDSLCRDLPPGLARLLPTSGAHHFGGDYDKLAKAVLAAARPS
jgi:type IV secretory pathway VirJ component